MIENVNNLAQAWWDWMWPMFWQVGGLVVVIGAVDWLFRRHLWPQLRYALWLLIVVKLILPPTFALPTGIISRVRPWVERRLERPLLPSESVSSALVATSAPEGTGLPHPDVDVPTPTRPLPHADPTAHSPSVAAGPSEVKSKRTQCAPQTILMAVWLAGVGAVGSWGIVRFRRISRLARADSGCVDAPDALAGALAAAAEKVGLRRVPRIVLSDKVGSAAVIGPFRPVLLIPADGGAHLSRRDAEHVFLHELTHIKRGDLLVQALCLFVQVFYWFNPFLWFVQRRLQHLRETCCDAAVVHILKDVEGYRQTILEAARQLLAKSEGGGIGLLGFVEDRSRLLSRVKDLEGRPRRRGKLRITVTLLAVGVVSACILPMAAARQPAGTPEESDPYVLSSEFRGRIEALRQILAGALSDIRVDRQDDGGMPVAVVRFAGAEQSPLVLHLTRADKAWVVDYFYTGSSDIVSQQTIPSRRQSPINRRFHVQGGKPGQRNINALADPRPARAVEKYIDNLRELVKGRETGQFMFSPSDGLTCALLVLQDESGSKSGYLAFHMVPEGERYRIECMETSDGVMQSPPRRVGPPRRVQTDPEEVIALDHFDGELGLDWDIIHADPSHYSLTKKPGTLTITTQIGHFKEGHTDYRNLFLIDTPVEDQDFQITTCLLGFRPLEAYNQAGLICWDDEDNYLEWIYQRMSRRGFMFAAGMEADGPTRYDYIPAGQPCAKLWLRITKRGDAYECASSTDGESFTVQTVQAWGDGSPERIGLFALDGSLTHPPEVDASFDFFDVRSAPPGRVARPSVTAKEPQTSAPAVPSDAEKLFEGRYLHRSRGRDYMQASFAKCIRKDGTLLYLLIARDTEYQLALDEHGLPERYEYASAPRNYSGTFRFSPGQVVWERQMPQRETMEAFNWRVGEGALPDLNSRPDPYLIQHVLLRSYDQDAGGEQVFNVYDIDSKGTGVNEYQVALTLVDEAGVTLPNGTFKAKHFLQVQQTASHTWYKKGPGSKTEYWIDDDFNILRIYRHREPYEVILEDYAGVPLAGSASTSRARTSGKFEIPEANR